MSLAECCFSGEYHLIKIKMTSINADNGRRGNC